jgi:hypothetical protein
MDANDVERVLRESVKARARELDRSAPPAPYLAGLLTADRDDRPLRRRRSTLGLGIAVVGVAAIVLGLTLWSLRAPGNPAVGDASRSPSTTPTAMPRLTSGSQATTLTWQTSDLSLPTAPAFEQLVPVGDRLLLITSDNGVSDPTKGASATIWTSADGLAWTKQSTDAIKSGWSDRPTFAAASPNGRGGAVVGGSEQATDGTERTAAWWTADGNSWKQASLDGPAGRMLSVAARPDGLVAVGITLSGGAAAWRSTDGGSSWASVTLPGGGRDAVDVAVWGERFVAVGRSQNANQLMLWTSSDGSTWSLVSSPSDPSFAPMHLIPHGDTLVVLGFGVPGNAILTCASDMTCARASVPALGHIASVTQIRAGAEVSGTIVVSTTSGAAGTAAPSPSVEAGPDLGLWASKDGRNWTALTTSPSLILLTSNLVVFRGRLVAVAFAGPSPSAATAAVVVGELR